MRLYSLKYVSKGLYDDDIMYYLTDENLSENGFNRSMN